MANHIVESYDEELNELHLLIAHMGNDVCAALETSCDDLVAGEKKRADQIIEQDRFINAQEHKITIRAQNILALRAPMATDLRVVLTSLQVANNLERVGDLTKNIAKINKKLTTPLPGDIATSLQKMSQLALSILQEAIAAYNNSDEASSQQVFEADLKLDQQHNALSKDVVRKLKTDEDNLESLTRLLFVIRHLERVGDHAKNIAESTIYMTTGEMNRYDIHEDSQEN